MGFSVEGSKVVSTRAENMIKLFSLKQQSKDGSTSQSSRKTSAAYLRIQKGELVICVSLRGSFRGVHCVWEMTVPFDSTRLDRFRVLMSFDTCAYITLFIIYVHIHG